MAGTTPRVSQTYLKLPNNSRSEIIAVDSPAWYSWLEEHNVFRFEDEVGTFTARKEPRPGGWYWYAYRRLQGKLHIAYLGRSQELTLAQLQTQARRLASSAAQETLPPLASAQTGDALLLTRLTIPPARADLLPRPRLLERLEAARSYKLTLLSAPAGFGKTTLLSAWSRAYPQQVAWLTLDESINDPILFWNYLIAALSALHVIPAQLAGLLRSPQPSARSSLLVLLSNALSAATREIFLVLDDYHLISEQEVHRTLALLLENSPAQLHLLLASRTSPPLPLSSLRAASKLLEIRGDNLRFDLDEVKTFLLQQPTPPLSNEVIALLEKRTEGWAAGLQLAALSLRDRANIDAFVHEFSGQDRYILEYLIEEVLLRQPPHIQRFLLHTSLLRSLTGALCDAVCQSSGSQKVLETLEKSNLFVVALDHRRHWYRYHQLFAEALFQRLQEDDSHVLPQLHVRAATWYESQGMYSEAIEHALEAGEIQFAATVVERVAEAILLRGETATVNGWLNALPAETVRSRPLLSCIQAFALLTQSRFEAVETYLLDAEHALSTSATNMYTAEDLQRIQGMLHTARSTVAANLGHAELAIRHAQEALTYLRPQDQALQAIVLHALGDAYELQDQLTDAARAFNEAFAMQQRAGSVFVAVTTLGSIGDIQAMTGQLDQAASTYRQALDLADTHTRTNGTPVLLPPAGKALVLLSELLYEWNELEEAERAARQGNELCLQWTHLWHTSQSYLSLARILLVQGRAEQAYQALDQAQHTLDKARTIHQQPAQPLLNRSFTWLTERIATRRISFLLFEGKLGQAQQQMSWLETQIDASTADTSFLRTMAQIELALATRQPAQALALLAPLLDNARQHNRLREQIELLLFQALALAQRDEMQDALQSLAQALNLGEHARYMRVFLDKGPALLPLLQKAYAQATAPAYTRSILSAFAQPVSTETEKVNAREREVLHLLAAGLSNQAIAAQLIIAPGTVKWYVHGIYSKLGVHSRTQAIAEARKRGLVL